MELVKFCSGSISFTIGLSLCLSFLTKAPLLGAQKIVDAGNEIPPQTHKLGRQCSIVANRMGLGTRK